MVDVSEVGWGKYQMYEGPFFKGTQRYILPSNPDEDAKILAVVTATEGGHLDAINMYDRCICSVGILQFCESAQFSVSDLLGHVVEKAPDALKPIDLLSISCGYEFHRSVNGQWRFHIKTNNDVVESVEQQRRMFLKDSTGKIGSWNEESKLYAKHWAAAMASVWESHIACQIQIDFSARRLMGFCVPYALEFLRMTPATQIGKAFKAMYLSFAANNPTYAGRHLEIANKSALGRHQTWSLDWLIHVAKELTFGPGISIYPARWNAIRPVLEKLYGISLPDLADELKKWSSSTGVTSFYDVQEVQNALLALGYDLGPAGADGVCGRKTVDAVLKFQMTHSITEEQDGMIGPATAKELERVLEKNGLEALS